ncbi:ABC transporter substrate-binding protein [Stackebrandtia nassauensis]|uniref:ABC-type branched-chain amino acid transport systems periplasmic component-like protein n=1 Tax=Stackebrandtia nassauensis (strain DSM 44728 / CIP 108903 / NRRL B-16338 / NBRC 102104 / LLR-40K-21) TaxID=446470 RepID=D3PXL5_STANL|nr:ABC transporter substrate-binding protein [Stackebrandtia nassauensis]ADD43345.1 ABC-type branched-chain amino acid transport systems periplasmic component-like protein [Stackebrandtia nassauensis DSM 44728]
MSIRLTRRRFLSLTSAGLVATPLAACTSSDPNPDTLKIGWVGPLTGKVKIVGEEMRTAAELYLKLKNDKLGGRKAELVVVDEGDTPKDAMPKVQELIKDDEITALTGILYSPTYLATAELAQERGIPLLGSGGRPEMDPEKLNNLDGLWHTSWINGQTSEALAPYVYKEIGGPVYVIGPDDAGGYGYTKTFAKTYKELGGKLANPGGKPTMTPYPETSDWTVYLDEIHNSKAEAVFVFYGGESAVGFVKQYAASDVKKIPLFTSFITEGSVLQAQGKAALGIKSSVPYATDLDNNANRKLISAWSDAREDLPSTMAVGAWDSMLVLDMAIGRIPDGEEVTREAVKKQIDSLGEIESPRGVWQMGEKTHAPVQRYYLREVRKDGEVISNVALKTLATLGE